MAETFRTVEGSVCNEGGSPRQQSDLAWNPRRFRARRGAGRARRGGPRPRAGERRTGSAAEAGGRAGGAAATYKLVHGRQARDGARVNVNFCLNFLRGNEHGGGARGAREGMGSAEQQRTQGHRVRMSPEAPLTRCTPPPFPPEAPGRCSPRASKQHRGTREGEPCGAGRGWLAAQSRGGIGQLATVPGGGGPLAVRDGTRGPPCSSARSGSSKIKCACLRGWLVEFADHSGGVSPTRRRTVGPAPRHAPTRPAGSGWSAPLGW